MPNQHPKAISFLCSYSLPRRSLEGLLKTGSANPSARETPGRCYRERLPGLICKHSGHSENKSSWVPKTRGHFLLGANKENYAVVVLPHRSGLILPATCVEFVARGSITASRHK